MVETLHEASTNLLRWIPALPLFAACIHGLMLGLLRKQAPRWLVIAVSCGAVLGSFAISLYTVITKLIPRAAEDRLLIDAVFTWISAGDFQSQVAFQLDPLSAVMILVVTGVGFLIHVYSIGYMDDDHREDRGFQRFFCYLNLFTFAMLMLVLADNLPLLFLGWEGVGLCSYLLIGFWYSDSWNAYCGSKAFIVNRIGDFGFLLGFFFLFWALAGAGVPTASFRGIEEAFAVVAAQTVQVPAWLASLSGVAEWRLATVIGLCFFVGACGKSAQLPLYVWLPDAMAGPTPVSALIHAATMVTAGVYLVCRMHFLYAEAVGASTVIAWVGGLTAIFAATVAICQNDIKKVLAYSTVSQLGYMFMAAGCGAYTAAVFHLGTHAFFKALLFLGSGAVILAMHHEQDMRKMGGLAKKLPITHGLFLIGVLAIAGVPPLSGFFSKDEILLSVYTSHVAGHQYLYAIGLCTALLTAFYMMRLHALTFWGKSRVAHDVEHHIEEPADTVIFPLWVLAGLAIVASIAGIPPAWAELLPFLDADSVEHSNSLANFLGPIFGHHEMVLSRSAERTLAGYAVITAVTGLISGWWLYAKKPEIAFVISRVLAPLHKLLENKYYIDEIYQTIFVNPLIWISDRVFYKIFDAGVIDGLGVNGPAKLVRGFALRGLRRLQSGLVQSYILMIILGSCAIVAYLVR